MCLARIKEVVAQPSLPVWLIVDFVQRVVQPCHARCLPLVTDIVAVEDLSSSALGAADGTLLSVRERMLQVAVVELRMWRRNFAHTEMARARRRVRASVSAQMDERATEQSGSNDDVTWRSPRRPFARDLLGMAQLG